MTYRRGDIVLVPFPFSDLSATKKRPVLALTSADAYGDFLAVALTSRSHHVFGIPVDASDLVTGELPVASWVRIDRVITLNSGLVSKTFARATPEFVVQILDRPCERARSTESAA